MAKVAQLFADEKLLDVRTHFASGNVSFSSEEPPSYLSLEDRFKERFGFETSVILCSVTQIDELLDQVSSSLIRVMGIGSRPLVDPKIEGFRFIVALSNGEHNLNSNVTVPRVELIDSFHLGSLWRWTIEDGKPPSSMEKLFPTKTTTRFAHALEKIYQGAR